MANILWTEEETLKLKELLSEDAIQEMLEGSKSNKDVYARGLLKNRKENDTRKVVNNAIVRSSDYGLNIKR